MLSLAVVLNVAIDAVYNGFYAYMLACLLFSYRLVSNGSY